MSKLSKSKYEFLSDFEKHFALLSDKHYKNLQKNYEDFYLHGKLFLPSYNNWKKNTMSSWRFQEYGTTRLSMHEKEKIRWKLNEQNLEEVIDSIIGNIEMILGKSRIELFDFFNTRILFYSVLFYVKQSLNIKIHHIFDNDFIFEDEIELIKKISESKKFEELPHSITIDSFVIYPYFISALLHLGVCIYNDYYGFTEITGIDKIDNDFVVGQCLNSLNIEDDRIIIRVDCINNNDFRVFNNWFHKAHHIFETYYSIQKSIIPIMFGGSFPLIDSPDIKCREVPDINIEKWISSYKKYYKYDIALSFAGEDREYVKNVANELQSKGIRIFYDEFERANLWGKDLYQHLCSIYQSSARYCIIFISKYYKEKLWTKHELKNAQARAFIEEDEYILPVRFDNTEINGINSTTGYIDLRKTSMSEFISIIYEKLKFSY